jgi:hypothetical protein
LTPRNALLLLLLLLLPFPQLLSAQLSASN